MCVCVQVNDLYTSTPCILSQHYVMIKVSKVGDRNRGRPIGYVLNIYHAEI